jgi:hypothetical protein
MREDTLIREYSDSLVVGPSSDAGWCLFRGGLDEKFVEDVSRNPGVARERLANDDPRE